MKAKTKKNTNGAMNAKQKERIFLQITAGNVAGADNRKKLKLLGRL